jgi:hypothetical protein
LSSDESSQDDQGDESHSGTMVYGILKVFIGFDTSSGRGPDFDGKAGQAGPLTVNGLALCQPNQRQKKH